MKTLKIAILGAQGSGKSWLANALLAHESRVTVVESSVMLDFKGFELILLMGLDLCPQAERQKQDAALRASLGVAQAAYHVIYGFGEIRQLNALSAVQRKFASINIANNAIFHETFGDELLKDLVSPRWQWRCEKCSDADCEHRLFTALKLDKQNAGNGQPI